MAPYMVMLSSIAAYLSQLVGEAAVNKVLMSMTPARSEESTPTPTLPSLGRQ
jgi:hypothetical protein